MKYVKHFDILGIDTAQVSCIELQGVPNSATEGAVGLLGVNMLSDEHEVYLCTAVNGSVYTWQCLKDGKDGAGIVKTEINDIGELVITLSDGKTLNAGVVKGKDGVDGINGENGKDGNCINNITISDKNELLVEMTDGTIINAGTLPNTKGDDGVSVVKAEFNNAGDLVLTLSSGELLTVGHIIPTLQDWLGTDPIGSDTHYIYYDGEKFVERAVSIKDETTEWAQIALMSEQIASGEKTPEELGLAVGQEKTVTLSTGEEVTFVILGFNHDDLADGSGKAGITFGMRDLLETPYQVWETVRNEYNLGFSDTMLPNVLTTIKNSLPNELVECIKNVKKWSIIHSYAKYTDGYRTSYGDGSSSYGLFLFNIEEVLGVHLSTTHHQQYPYFNTAGAGKGLGGMTPYRYALRDIYKDMTTPYRSGIYSISETGGISYANLLSNDESFPKTGICFGFCI